ncbi:MAG: modulator protein, partial [Marinovum sp.]|nr:modulator protein [Marinovum sp.]
MADSTALLVELTEKMLVAARSAGAEQADAIAVSGSTVGIDVRKSGLEHAERSEATEIGLRVLLDRRQAIVSGSDLRDTTLSAMAERAVAMAKAAPEDVY